jgi:inorganic pyrophosphatase
MGDVVKKPELNAVEMIVEIPLGSRFKYEIDPASSELWLDRELFTAMRYPVNYGFFPRTKGGDGDALDALVLTDDPLVSGCHLWVRPLAVLNVQDQSGDDQKVLTVACSDPRYLGVTEITQLPDHVLAEIRHFFSVYKDLEPGKFSKVGQWSGSKQALIEVAESQRAYLERA